MRLDRVIVLSAQATLDGHPLTEGYDRLKAELAGWDTLECPNGARMLFRHRAKIVTTRLEFAGRRFIHALIAHTGPVGCADPFPGQ